MPITTGLELTDDERYAAICARDARFDGMFVMCVRSTRIFCRPSCPARTPRRDMVDFAPTAAAALDAGFRACKRCGPAAPPGSPADDPRGSLTQRALGLIEQGMLDEGSVPQLAARLCVSERTLHRALLATTGAGALAHARMRRARRAHELVAGSSLPLAQVAHAAGFGSERQFHDTFVRVYGHAPSVVRERSGARPAVTAPLAANLAVRRPFDGEGLAHWFAARAVPGVESVNGSRWTRAVRLPHGPAVLSCELGPSTGPLPLTLRLADLRDYGAAVALARRLLDLDADPLGIEAGLRAATPALGPLLDARPGVRIPGTPSLAEALVWAITGQQVTTEQARDQITRATDLLATELPSSLHLDGVHRAPPDPFDAARAAETWYRGPAARRRALMDAVPAVPDEAGPPAEVRAGLLAQRGVGPWTADYAAMRGIRAIDVAPARDVALLAAARDLGLADDHPELAAVLEQARPWRSYAVMHLWQHAAHLPDLSARRGAAPSKETP